MESWVAAETSVMSLVFDYLTVHDVQRWRWTSSVRAEDTRVLFRTSWSEYVCSKVQAHSCGNCFRTRGRRFVEHCGCCERIVCHRHLANCEVCGTTGCEECVYHGLCHECRMC